MPVAIFGIENDGLNLAANLVVLMLVVLYFALIVWTYLDARRRVEDPVLVACATVGSLIPFIGAAVYAILRPPEFLEDAHERELEIKAAELRVRQLSELSCPNCGYPVEKNFLRCPSCQRRLKDPCQGCGKPVDPRWALCPYCETPLPGRARQARPPAAPRPAAQRPPESAPRVKRGARKPPPPPPSRTQPSRRASAIREADGARREREGEGKS